jgi:colanic acid biosynthesis glycosyl transferase WcaI
MHILYVSQYYPPEIGAPAARVSELSRHWARAEHDVEVLTGFPNHPTGKIPAGYRRKMRRLTMRERHGNVLVTRTWLIPLPNRKSWERMVNYSSFCISAIIRGLFVRKPDVLIATSPQLLAGLAGLVIAKLRRIPFVLEVRDLWPESLEAVGVADATSALHRTLKKLATILYRNAAEIVVVTPAFREHISKHYGISAEKIWVIPNGVETDLFRPDQGAARPFGLELLPDRFVVSFIGTIGNAHGLETLVRTAASLQVTHPRMLFLIVGEGAEKEKLRGLIQAAGLTNVQLIGEQPRENVPDILRASDVSLVLLKRSPVFRTVVPTKMLEAMASGTPVILGVEGQAQEILEEAQAGLCVTPEDSDALTAAITHLYSEPELRRQLGRNGQQYITEKLSREATARSYLELLTRMISRGLQVPVASA